MTSFDRRIVSICGICAAIVFSAAAFGGELRTWKAATGAYSVDAEFIELKPGDVVHLKTKDGRDVDVPLAQLSPADRSFVQAQVAPGAKAGVSPQLAKMHRDAARYRLPDEALVVYRKFHDDPATTPADRDAAMAKIKELREAAANKLVRSKGQWVAAADAAAVRKQVDQLIQQAFQFAQLGQGDLAKRRFSEAALIDPDDIHADFAAGLYYLMSRDIALADTHFRRCLKREPDNLAVINNLALVAEFKRQWREAVALWNKGLDLGTEQRLVHNVGLHLSKPAGLTTDGIGDLLYERYRKLGKDRNILGKYDKVGTLYFLNDELHFDWTKFTGVMNRPVAAESPSGRPIDVGSGFVVAKGYVLTDAQLLHPDATYELQMRDGSVVAAELVESSPAVGLALLKYTGWGRPLPISEQPVAAGDRIVVSGFSQILPREEPQQFYDVVRAGPLPGFDDEILFSPQPDDGVRGGPICDELGNVVALQRGPVSQRAKDGRGLVNSAITTFLKQAIPGYASPPLQAKLDLTLNQLHQFIGEGTARIVVRSPNAPQPRVGDNGTIETAMCHLCYGLGFHACNNKLCKNGVQFDGGRRMVVCNGCSGTLTQNCAACNGTGYDLNVVQVPPIPDPSYTGKKPLRDYFYKGHRYHVFLERLTWSQAREKCRAMGGYLACMEDPHGEGIVNAVQERIGSENLGKNYFWVGGTQIQGNWKWLTGPPVARAPKDRVVLLEDKRLQKLYVYFDDQPDKNCLAYRDVDAFQDGKPLVGLRDDETDTIAGFICEWDSWRP